MISILVPVYNESDILEDNISKLKCFLDEIINDYEIIACSNGSTDDTDKIGLNLQQKYSDKFRFISIPTKGVGNAFKEMVKASKYEKLVSIDVDLTTDMNFIYECITLLDKYDIVIGSKIMGEQKRNILRIAISKTYISLVHILLGLDYVDYSIGSKGYLKSKIIPYIQNIDYGSSYVVELVYSVQKENNIIEIPVICDDTRKSKFNLLNEIFYRFKNILLFFIQSKLK